MSTRRVVTVAAVLVAGAAIPAAALVRTNDSTGQRTFSPTKRTVAYTTVAVTTTDTKFQDVPGLDDLLVQNRDAATVHFSADFSGAPVEIRAVRLPEHPLLPGIARFAPTGESTSFSFQFLEPRGRGIECRRFAVQWRSPSGAEVTLNYGTLAVDYRFDNRDRNGLQPTCVD